MHTNQTAMKSSLLGLVFGVLVVSLVGVWVFKSRDHKAAFQSSVLVKSTSAIEIKNAPLKKAEFNPDNVALDEVVRAELPKTGLASLARNAEVLDQQEKATAQKGVVVRSKLLKTHFKYPYVRVQETVV